MKLSVLGLWTVIALLTAVPADAGTLLFQGPGGGFRVETPEPPETPLPPAPPAARAPSGPRLRGKLDSHATVSIDASEERVGDILWEIAEDAEVDLVMSAPRSLLRQRLSIRLNERPVREALEVVLEATQLEAEADGRMLTVRAVPGIGIDLPEMLDGVRTHRGQKPRLRDSELIVFGQPLEVKAGETVAEAVVVGGPLSVRGHVTGNAMAIGGPVVVWPEAAVDGDVVSIGGSVDVREGATVKGDKVALSGPGTGLGSLISAATHGELTANLLDFFDVASTILRYLTLFVLGLLLLAFAPERVQRVQAFLVRRPGASAVAGFALLIGIVPLSVLLAVTVIGIPLIFVAVFLLIAFLVMGLTAIMVLVGHQLPVLQQRKTMMLEMLLGLGIVALVDLLPVIGTVLVFLAAFVSGGAALLSRFGGEPKVGAAAGTAEL